MYTDTYIYPVSCGKGIRERPVNKMGRGVVAGAPWPPPALYSHRLGGVGIAGEVTVFTVSREGKRAAPPATGGGTTRKPLRKISPPPINA
jgi:hypothetical protein